VISHLGGAQRASIIAKGAGVPSIHVVHNDADITKVHARHAQYLVYNTHWVLESFRASQSYRPPGMVVRPPVDPSKYETETSRRYITLVNLSDGSGWVNYDKGPKVFYELAKRFPEEEFLGVIGAYGNQDIRTDYPNVTFMEQTGDARDFYSQSKIIISPSGYESYGRISVEAAASGIPSITSTAPGFLEHQVGYRRVDFRDVDGWEDALRSLLKPRNYSSASKKAKLKSAELWKQSQRELQEFVAECERVARLKQPRRR
jgi:glycosyltransferase involved in cell wall biosynthesis